MGVTYATKELYLAELRMVDKITYESISSSTTYFSQDVRYTLVRKKDGDFYDIFTRTEYPVRDEACEGEECIYRKKAIITNREELTYDEATCILESLNPTCIIKEVEKPKGLFRR